MPKGFDKPAANPVKIFLLLMLTFASVAMLFSSAAVAQSPSADSVKNKKTSDQPASKRSSLELYGFILTDVIYDFKQMDPKWYDVPRLTKLPSYKRSVCS